MHQDVNLNAVKVLLSSGDEDVWEKISGYEIDMQLGGALVIKNELDEKHEYIEAVYAPGMWMKIELHESR